MTYTLTPKQGDTVRVRHPEKGLCDAIYSHRAFDKDHCVECDKEFCVASFYPHYEIGKFTRVRFSYPLSLMPKPEVRE